MNWNDALFEVIDLRSFSNIWYWFAVAVTWSTLSHWILGVPFDMIFRARRYGGDAQTDLEALVRINVNRLMAITDVAGLWIMGFICFALSGLGLMGFYYQFELAQGMFCLGFPAAIVAALSLRASRKLHAKMLHGAELCSYLMLHRFWIQLIAMISIFTTAVYGMYHNLSLPLGF